MTKRILVWDLPTRVFHWLLALSFAGAFLTAESERLRGIHVVLGYTVLGLVAFRLVWGFFGTRYARFSSFWYRPRQVAAYLKSVFSGTPEHHVGHNPAGSWAIYGLLSLTAATGASGWLVFNDMGGRMAEGLHEGLANVMLALVAVHVAGVAVSSLLHRENLVRSMWNGGKHGDARAAASGPRTAIGIALLAAVLAFWVDSALSPPPAAQQIASEYRRDRH